MIKTDRYYVLYNNIDYIDEHNTLTGEKITYPTGFTASDFGGYGNGVVKFIGLAIDYDYVYILYSNNNWLTGGYRVGVFTHNLGLINTYTINYPEVTSIASDGNTSYLAYRDFDGIRKVSSVGGTFTPIKTLQCNINKIFGYGGVLYGFELGTIRGSLYKINVQSSKLTKVKTNAQKSGLDYGAQRTKFYGYAYPGYLEYTLSTGEKGDVGFTPTYTNYVLGALPASDGISNQTELIIITEAMFMVKKGKVTYPSLDTGTLHEVEQETVYDNFSPNENLYTEG